MCFNYQVSLFTFFIGLLFSLLLIYKGNKKYKSENIVAGIFFIFISFIQFMDFLLWIDINNAIGLNKIVTIIGPILNICQPLILYAVKYLYYKPLLNNNVNIIVALLNLLYFIYFITTYITFLSNDKLITTVKHKHLKWPWIDYLNPYFYLILLTINVFYLFKFKYALMSFIILFLSLLLSKVYFNYNVGELWCFFGAFIPLVLYYLSYII